MQPIITSAQNPQVKRLQKLQDSRRYRREEGAFVAEGVKLAEEALQSGVSLQTLYCTERAAQRYPDAVERLSQAAGQTVYLSEELGQKIGQAATPQGIYAVCTALDNGARLAKIEKNGRYLLAHSLQDPGNLGTIIRSCCAFGADGLVLSADCPDLYSPKVLRASMGGVFRLPILVAEDLPAFVAELRGAGMRVYAAALHPQARPIGELELGDGCCVLIGNEGNGLPEDLCDRCDCRTIIPIAPGTESLNAAIAASIYLYEMARPRR